MLGRPTIVAALGTTQTVAWASSYYLVAILADPIAEELPVPKGTWVLHIGDSFVHAFIAPAKQDHSIELRKTPRRFLTE